MLDEVKDANAAPSPAPDAKADPSTAVTDANSDPSPETLPFDKHPKWISARQTEKKVQDIMEANGFEDFEVLVEHIQLGKTLKGKVGDVSALEKALERSQTLDKYEKYWEEQKERQLKETETPEQRAERLEKELKDLKSKDESSKKQRDADAAAAKAIKDYESEVSSTLSDLPKEDKAFLAEFLGVGNSCNEIDIADKKAVKKMVADARKKLEAFQQATIKAYLAGKVEVPDIGPTGGGTKPAPAAEETKNFKLKDARKMAAERMTAFFKGTP